jgi:holo-[acyl-carrier protein] synthase
MASGALVIIIGTGTDIIGVGRLKEAWGRTGDHFLDRVFTPGEREYCRRFKDPWPHLAARFAAKESVIKALGVSIDPRDVEVLSGSSGQPRIVLRGRASELGRERGVLELKASLSHTKELAIAQVIAVGGPSSSSSPLASP